MMEIQEWAFKPDQSGSSPGSFANINRGKTEYPDGDKAVRCQGLEAAGGYIFYTWKKQARENNVSRWRAAQTGDGEPWRVYISLSVVPKPSLYFDLFIATCLPINSSFAQAGLIGFLPLSSKSVLTY